MCVTRGVTEYVSQKEEGAQHQNNNHFELILVVGGQSMLALLSLYYLLYKCTWSFECLLSPTKCNNILEYETCFIDLPIETPLSQLVNGVAGQTDILSNSPLHVGHSNAIYYGIGCRVG